MYANVNGVKLFFDVEGKQYVPDGPVMKKKPVCMVLHGGPGGNHYHYLPGFSPLSEDMQLIYVDHRGCGLSGPCDVTTCTMEQNADDVEALRQYLGLDKVIICGHSYGGMVAQAYALKYPESMCGLILSSTSPSDRFSETLPVEMEKRATDEMKEQLAIMWDKGDLTEEDCKRYMKTLNPLYHYHYNKKECDEGVERSLWSPEVFRYGNTKVLPGFDYVPDLPKVGIHTLVIAGKEDFITPPVHSEEIANALPDAELVILEEAAHETYEDQPEAYYAAVRKYLADLEV